MLQVAAPVDSMDQAAASAHLVDKDTDGARQQPEAQTESAETL